MRNVQLIELLRGDGVPVTLNGKQTCVYLMDFALGAWGHGTPGITALTAEAQRCYDPKDVALVEDFCAIPRHYGMDYSFSRPHVKLEIDPQKHPSLLALLYIAHLVRSQRGFFTFAPTEPEMISLRTLSEKYPPYEFFLRKIHQEKLQSPPTIRLNLFLGGHEIYKYGAKIWKEHYGKEFEQEAWGWIKRFEALLTVRDMGQELKDADFKCVTGCQYVQALIEQIVRYSRHEDADPNSQAHRFLVHSMAHSELLRPMVLSAIQPPPPEEAPSVCNRISVLADSMGRGEALLETFPMAIIKIMEEGRQEFRPYGQSFEP